MPDDKPWIALMRTGYFTDMKGRGLRVEMADLIRIQASYNPAEYKAPLFLDAGWHTNTSGDAAGWVDRLRLNGDFLEAQVVDVPFEIKFSVAEGRRRQVSVEVDLDDMGRPASLSRVALLGASPPAITGLPPLDPAAFEDGATLKFSKPSESGGRETAWIISDKEGKVPKDPNTPTPQAGDSAQMIKLSEDNAALTKRLDTLEASFTESKKENAALTKRLEAAEGRANRLASEADKAEIAAFTKGLVESGKLPPGLNTPELAAFVAGLDNTQPKEGEAGTLMFTAPPAESGQEPKPEAVSPRAFFTRWLGGLPQLVKDGHQFTAAPAGAGDKDASDEAAKLIAGKAGKKED